MYINKTFQQVKREVGDVSILVNNAGMVSGKYTFLEAPDSLVDRTLRVNAAAHFWVKKKTSKTKISIYLWYTFFIQQVFNVMRTLSSLLSQKLLDVLIHRLTRHFSQQCWNETMGTWCVWHAMEPCLQ